MILSSDLVFNYSNTLFLAGPRQAIQVTESQEGVEVEVGEEEEPIFVESSLAPKRYVGSSLPTKPKFYRRCLSDAQLRRYR